MEYLFKTEPDKYQKVALERALKQRKFGIFFQQRVGKTKVALDFCGNLPTTSKPLKILVVCPLSVRLEWVHQLSIHFPNEYKAALFSKDLKFKAALEESFKGSKPVFVIINYDIIAKNFKYLNSLKFDVMIFDESHLLSSPTSKRSRTAFKLTKDIENVLLLTGTPIPKRWYNIFSQFRVMNSTIFGTSWTAFKDNWAILGGYMGKEIIGCTDYDGISKAISEHSVRVLRADTFSEPNIEDVMLPVILSPKPRKQYEALKKQFIVELENETKVTADMALTRLTRLHQFCGGFVKSDEGEVIQVSKDKLDAAKDLIHTIIEGGEQVVVFYRYTSEGQNLLRELTSITPKPIGQINGRISENERKYFRDKFQAGESDIILIQISTGVMGISLDKAHKNVFYSLDFSLSNFLQAKDRVLGRNQKHNVTNYFLVVDKTVDVRVINILRKDEDIASKVSDTWKLLLEGDML